VVTASYTGEWALFQDYCAATSQPSLPTTPAAVAGFLAALPARPATLRRRRRAIAAAHQHAGWNAGHLRPDLKPASQRRSGLPPSTVESPPGESRHPEEAGTLIAACPTRGWPTGFTGRRDAFLVVLVEVLGRTRDQARQLTPSEITTTGDGFRIGGAAAPATTPTPARSAQWPAGWRSATSSTGLGRAIAREALTAAAAPSATSPHTHVPCHQRWRQAPWLMIGIDQRGWLHDTEPLSARSTSTRLIAIRARRQDPATAAR